jgi:hypothetical protein
VSATGRICACSRAFSPQYSSVSSDGTTPYSSSVPACLHQQVGVGETWKCRLDALDDLRDDLLPLGRREFGVGIRQLPHRRERAYAVTGGLGCLRLVERVIEQRVQPAHRELGLHAALVQRVEAGAGLLLLLGGRDRRDERNGGGEGGVGRFHGEG